MENVEAGRLNLLPRFVFKSSIPSNKSSEETIDVN